MREDLRIVGEGFAAIVAAMGEANFNPAAGEAPSAAGLATLQAAAETLETVEFTAAAGRLSDWLDTECGR
jgi:mevalonate pyrophosphate decarboxylase